MHWEDSCSSLSLSFISTGFIRFKYNWTHIAPTSNKTPIVNSTTLVKFVSFIIELSSINCFWIDSFRCNDLKNKKNKLNVWIFENSKQINNFTSSNQNTGNRVEFKYFTRLIKVKVNGCLKLEDKIKKKNKAKLTQYLVYGINKS